MFNTDAHLQRAVSIRFLIHLYIVFFFCTTNKKTKKEKAKGTKVPQLAHPCGRPGFITLLSKHTDTSSSLNVFYFLRMSYLYFLICLRKIWVETRTSCVFSSTISYLNMKYFWTTLTIKIIKFKWFILGDTSTYKIYRYRYYIIGTYRF